MSRQTLSFIGSKELATVRLRILFLSHIAIAILCAIVISFGIISVQTRDPWPFLLASFLVLFFVHAMKLFLQETLENDAQPLRSDAPLQSYLSHELLSHLAPKKVISAGDLLDAAVRTRRGKFLLEELSINAQDMIAKCKTYIDQNVQLELFLDYAKQLLPQFRETRIDANIAKLRGQKPADSVAAPAATEAAPKVRKYNPETGKIE